LSKSIPALTPAEMGQRSGASRQADALLRRGHDFAAVAHLLTRAKRQDVAAELRSIANQIITERSDPERLA
jgi:hypothetical protein